MNENMNGFDRKEVTLYAAATAVEGNTVNLISKTTAGASPEGSDFIGVCTLIRNGMASVTLRGYATVPFSGTSPSLGYNKLSADGSGGVKVSDSGRSILVVDINKSALTCDIIL